MIRLDGKGFQTSSMNLASKKSKTPQPKKNADPYQAILTIQVVIPIFLFSNANSIAMMIHSC